MNMKIAILGEKKSVLAFKALGLETFGIKNKEDLEKAETKIKEENFAILFITEDIAKTYEKEIESFYEKTLPALLVIPGTKGGGEKGKEELDKILERALGSKLIEIK